MWNTAHRYKSIPRQYAAQCQKHTMEMQFRFPYSILCVAFLLILLHDAASEKIDCENTDNIDESQIHLCCKHPETHDTLVDVCAKETGFEVSYSSNNKSEALLDVSADRAMASTCFGKCIFDKYGFLDKEKNLDMEAVRKHYNTTHSNDVEYVREMIAAFDHCHGQTEQRLSKFLGNGMFHEAHHKSCDPKPSVIWACVVREFFHNCPSDRWCSTKNCTFLREFSKQCPNALSSL